MRAVFVTDRDNHTIRQISLDGTVTTLCGYPKKRGSTNGKGSSARFDEPWGIAVSPGGTLFVADTKNHTIRQITLDGTVTTLCGSAQQQGSTNGKGSAARFCFPHGIACSSEGTLFVSESNNHTIRQISLDGTVT